MFCYIKLVRKVIVSTLGVFLFFTTQLFGIELNMYYPVAVGGSLTKIVDGMVDEFEKKNPDVKVNAIYAGNYNDARIKRKEYSFYFLSLLILLQLLYCRLIYVLYLP